jgi:hypothetical protein
MISWHTHVVHVRSSLATQGPTVGLFGAVHLQLQLQQLQASHNARLHSATAAAAAASRNARVHAGKLVICVLDRCQCRVFQTQMALAVMAFWLHSCCILPLQSVDQ